MSLSKQTVIRGGAEFPAFTADLRPIGVLGPATGRRSRIEVEIERLRADALEQGRAEGHGTGYDEGFRAGQEAGLELAKADFEAEVAAVRARLVEIVERAERAIDDWLEEAADHYAGVALEVARRALAAELAVGRESIVALAKEALGELREGTTVRMHVNPGDASLLESHRQQILQAVAGIKKLEIVSDDAVEAGCMVESEFGMVDARVEAYLDRIASQVRREAA